MGARGGQAPMPTLLGTQGRMPFHADMPECPLLTSSFASPAEMRGGSYAHPIRAYKLGKGKNSYNMLHVQITDTSDPTRRLEPLHAAKACQESENAAIFEAQMPYGIRMKLVFHMVYSASAEVFHYNEQDLYQWRMVCRGQCLQQCQGPILKPISRMGRQAMHSNVPHHIRQGAPTDLSRSKDPRFMYVSIDEASSHVGSLHSTFFRLIVGAYDFETGRLLGTSCSAPIAMCSNNDVPKKAPYIPIEIPVASGWPQWRLCPQAGAPSGPPPTQLASVCTAAPAATQRATAGASAAQHAQSSGMTVLAATAATQQQLAAGVPAPQRKAQRSGGQLSGAPGSPGRSASPRSATSMAYLGQPGTLAPSRPRHQQHSPLAKASQEWEDDSRACSRFASDPCYERLMSIVEAADAIAQQAEAAQLADAAAQQAEASLLAGEAAERAESLTATDSADFHEPASAVVRQAEPRMPGNAVSQQAQDPEPASAAPQQSGALNQASAVAAQATDVPHQSSAAAQANDAAAQPVKACCSSSSSEPGLPNRAWPGTVPTTRAKRMRLLSTLATEPDHVRLLND